MTKFITAMASLVMVITGCSAEPALGAKVKLYAIDCGSMEFFDMAAFSSNGDFDGQTADLANPCFLIRHRDGDLLWDTGLPQSMADMPDGVKSSVYSMNVSRKLSEQLAELGLTPADIEYLSLSHYHSDHSGNSNLFKSSTFIANDAERRFVLSGDEAADKDSRDAYLELKDTKTIVFKDEYDVFGDGAVRILSMPGHTPGNSALLVRLANSGAILLSGDLHILQRGRALRTVPTFNYDPAATLRSMDLFEALAERENARVVVQHDKSDFEALPQFPAYLD